MATKSSLNQSVPHSTSPERFKEICLRVGGESCKETLATLDYLFNPETFLDRSPNGVSLIKQYLTGGASYETFKNRRKCDIIFISIRISQYLQYTVKSYLITNRIIKANKQRN